MKSEIKHIQQSTDFPCLMTYHIDGDVYVGTYLVSEHKGESGNNYAVCLLISGDNLERIGTMYYKKELDIKEWSHMPKGTEITLTN